MLEHLTAAGFARLVYLAFPSLLIFYFLTNAIYNLYFSPLRAYPGPKLWAISSIPLEWSRIKGTQVFKLVELHKRYGKVIRTAPDELSSVDAVTWKQVWAHRQGHDEFGKLFIATGPSGVPGILSAKRAEHSRYRRLLSHSFSEKGMREQQPIIQSYVNKLISDLRKSASDGPQDLVAWFNWTTFDVIGRLAFGEDFSCLERCETHPWIEAVFNSLKALLFIRTVKRYGLLWLLPLIASKKTLTLRRYNFQFSNDRIESRIKRGSSEGDFWDNVLRKSDLSIEASQDVEHGMSFEEMAANASNIVLAGSETTATLLSGCVYQLLRNPRWMERVTQEIRGAFDSDDEIDLFSINSLPYTLAVLEETMRIYPPVPTQANRLVPDGGDTVDGIWLPGGTIIQIAQYAANHLPANFAMPDEFHPERFLPASVLSLLSPTEAAELDPEPFKLDDTEVMQPFSVGSRNCIGRNLAYAEMRLILAKFLWNFDIEATENTGSWMEDQKVFILWQKSPLWAKVTPVSKDRGI